MSFLLADPSLTTDKLSEVLKHVTNVVTLKSWLDTPDSKKEEIWSTRQTVGQRREGLVDVYINSHPCPSWESVTRALGQCGHTNQVEKVTTKYVEGKCGKQVVICIATFIS